MPAIDGKGKPRSRWPVTARVIDEGAAVKSRNTHRPTPFEKCRIHTCPKHPITERKATRPIDVGGRRSREIEGQPPCAQSVKMEFVTAAERRCQTYSNCRPAPSTPEWRVRMCRKQPTGWHRAPLSPLDVGQRKSRETEGQPRYAQSVEASLFAAATRRCQPHSSCRTAS